MTTTFDTRQVRRSFGRAAGSYEAASALQQEVASRLLERLDYVPKPPLRVLDLGCGPGGATLAMRKRWKSAQIISLDLALPMLQRIRGDWLRPLSRVCADARVLPLADASIDVLFSNLCIQWIDDVPALLNEFRRVLKTDGYLTLSTFGPDTLHELRTAWAATDAAPRVSRFADIALLGDAILRAGFRDPVLDSEHFTLTYRDAPSLMRELKAIGATNASSARVRGLTGKAQWSRVIAEYEKLRCDDVLPATYEVIYAHAWSPDAGQPRRGERGEIASFPIDRLRGSRR